LDGTQLQLIIIKWPELNPEKLRASLEEDWLNPNALSYEASWCFVVDAESATRKVTQALSKTTCDCVLIGAGVHIDPDAFIAFEPLLNAFHV